ncbi:DUF302 domain-containing protein [Roseovarius sp. BRH_c41]|jgi:uncharacterized protein (DUF302 family)|uniref:DUF302 domain-containing protein n=1 Tax=Roseovarius sp. BRH_c41 TaxID=1629709 RepID=UPI0005F0D14A|nr:DUF302 domain-containing protein [Roseovarius sp. BRH_c41]KJS45531.1 MAG: hypothetical protein VR71_01060 [Roseovarius sp. BRH_c41]
MQRFLAILSVFLFLSSTAQALEPRDGWVIHDTAKGFDALVEAVRAAVETAPIAIVTQASASDGARGQGITIPGNRIFGLYRNDYARRMLAASVAAGIEAPIRLYVTEEADGTATLSYKTPTAVFAPYFDEGGDDLRALATELDGVFKTVAQTAIAE